MKPLIPILNITGALALFAGNPLAGQQSPEPAVAPAVAEAVDKARAEVDRQLQKAEAEAKQQIERARMEVEKVQKQLGPAVAAAAESYSGPKTAYTWNFLRPGRGRPGKPLVVRSSNLDPKDQADLAEDLTVMSHLLDKALREELGGSPKPRTAMGISVFFAPGPGGMRSLYLEGYGALFLLNVGFPLLPPPAKAEEEKPKTTSEWEEAWKELYGPHEGGKAGRAPGEPYSEERVNKLKDALLEALKNATNVRGLKPEESVTVCVFGGAPATTAKVKATVHREPNLGDVALLNLRSGGGPTRGTVMTIRVKKSDAEAFSKGKLNLDDFRKKARITAYVADTGEEGDNVIFGGSGAAGGFGGGGSGDDDDSPR